MTRALAMIFSCSADRGLSGGGSSCCGCSCSCCPEGMESSRGEAGDGCSPSTAGGPGLLESASIFAGPTPSFLNFNGTLLPDCVHEPLSCVPSGLSSPQY